MIRVMNILSLSPSEKADCDAPSAIPYEDFDLQEIFQGEDQEQNSITPSLVGSGANRSAYKCKGLVDQGDKSRSKLALLDYNLNVALHNLTVSVGISLGNTEEERSIILVRCEEGRRRDQPPSTKYRR